MSSPPDWNTFLGASRFATRTLEWWAAESEAIFLAGGFAAPEAAAIDRILAEFPLTEPASILRRHRQLHALRIAWRDVAGLQDTAQTGEALAALATENIRRALDFARLDIESRWAVPVDAGGRPCRLAVIALGKLGGQDLNFSSDVDLLFVESGDGVCPGPRALSAAEYHLKLAQRCIALLDTVGVRGHVWRVDTRLRPHGTAGALVWSLAAAEQYYQSAGREWERYALLKARPIAGDEALGARFCAMTRPFVYRRYLDYGLLEGVRSIHADILGEARRHGHLDDLKRGPGGIREIEFLVQSQQLLRGGQDTELQTPKTLAALAVLRRRRLISGADAETLDHAYRALRTLENRLQMLDDRQTHRLPGNDEIQRRLAVLMGQPWPAVVADTGACRRAVGVLFERHFKDPHQPGRQWHELLRRARQAAGGQDDEDAGRRAMQSLGFQAGDDQAAWQHLRTGLAELDAAPLGATARRRLERLLPLLLQKTAAQDSGAIALARCLELVVKIVRRSAYLSLLIEKQEALDRLVGLLAQSATLTAWVSRQPALLDDLLDPALGCELPDRAALDEQMQIRLAPAGGDPERQHAALTAVRDSLRFKAAAGFLSGALTAQDVMHHLTQAAESVVATLLRILLAAGKPPATELDACGLAVIGYGALGAGELHFTSDLDLIFLYDPARLSEAGATGLARRLLHWLTLDGPGGKLYPIDTRLRPNGQSGQLVSSNAAFAEYQKTKAWTWEIQALARARPVAGDQSVAAAFNAVRRTVLTRPRPAAALRRDLRAMRDKLRAAHQGAEPLKHGQGALLDIQFIAQFHHLSLAARHPALVEPAHTGELLRRLPAAAPELAADAAVLHAAWLELQNARYGLELTGRDEVDHKDTLARVAAIVDGTLGV